MTDIHTAKHVLCALKSTLFSHDEQSFDVSLTAWKDCALPGSRGAAVALSEWPRPLSTHQPTGPESPAPLSAGSTSQCQPGHGGPLAYIPR